MMNLLRRLSTRDNFILLLTLTALACLPISLNKVVRDAALSLLLPVTILGAILAFSLASVNIKKTWAGIILIVCGPLMLFIRVAQMGSAILATVRESLFISSQIFVTAHAYTQSNLEFSA